MGVARARLQAATARIHEELHQAAPFVRIAGGGMGCAEYGALLVMLHRYHASLVDMCAMGATRLGLPELAVAHARRLSALRGDMHFLGQEILPIASVVADEADFAVGGLYTVQGSTLGGKLIHRQLDGLLPDGQGRSFFAGSVDDGVHWRLFCEGLEAMAPALDFTRVEAGALFAFGRFRNLLEECLAVPA